MDGIHFINDDLVGQYADLCAKQRYLRNIIDGELNRIAITEDDNERFHMCYFLMMNIPKYIDVSKQVNEFMGVVTEEIQKHKENKELKGFKQK